MTLPTASLHVSSLTAPRSAFETWPAFLEYDVRIVLSPRYRAPRTVFLLWLATMAWSTSLLGHPGATAAQSAATPPAGVEDLTRLTRTWAGVNARVQAAVPQARRGLELVAGPRSPEAMEAAVKAIDTAYRYLRAAQQSSRTLESVAKFEDPVRKIQQKRMWSIRVLFLGCYRARNALVELKESALASCTENMQEAIRQLDTLVAVMY